jgi:hypothetical protein
VILLTAGLNPHRGNLSLYSISADAGTTLNDLLAGIYYRNHPWIHFINWKIFACMFLQLVWFPLFAGEP